MVDAEEVTVGEHVANLPSVSYYELGTSNKAPIHGNTLTSLFLRILLYKIIPSFLLPIQDMQLYLIHVDKNMLTNNSARYLQRLYWNYDRWSSRIVFTMPHNCTTAKLFENEFHSLCYENPMKVALCSLDI